MDEKEIGQGMVIGLIYEAIPYYQYIAQATSSATFVIGLR